MTFMLILCAFGLGFVISPGLSTVKEYLNKPASLGPWGEIGRCLCCDAGYEAQDLKDWLKPGDRRICPDCGICDPIDPKRKTMIRWIGRWSGEKSANGRKSYVWLEYEKMPEDLRPERDPLLRLADALQNHD